MRKHLTLRRLFCAGLIGIALVGIAPFINQPAVAYTGVGIVTVCAVINRLLRPE